MDIIFDRVCDESNVSDRCPLRFTIISIVPSVLSESIASIELQTASIMGVKLVVLDFISLTILSY